MEGGEKMPATMAEILAMLGSVVTSVVGILGEVVTAVVAQPLLLIGVGIGLLGSGVALVKKFM